MFASLLTLLFNCFGIQQITDVNLEFFFLHLDFHLSFLSSGVMLKKSESITQEQIGALSTSGGCCILDQNRRLVNEPQLCFFRLIISASNHLQNFWRKFNVLSGRVDHQEVMGWKDPLFSGPIKTTFPNYCRSFLQILPSSHSLFREFVFFEVDRSLAWAANAMFFVTFRISLSSYHLNSLWSEHFKWWGNLMPLRFMGGSWNWLQYYDPECAFFRPDILTDKTSLPLNFAGPFKILQNSLGRSTKSFMKTLFIIENHRVDLGQ